MFGVSYIDAVTADSFSDLSANIKDGRLGYDVKRIGASAAYTYNLSKRSSTYAMVGYWRDSYDFQATAKTDVDPPSVAVALGIRINF